MDWVPIVFVTFKIIVLGLGMFFAVKWHYDKGARLKEARAVLRAGSKIALVFVLVLVVLLLLTFGVSRFLGLNLSLS